MRYLLIAVMLLLSESVAAQPTVTVQAYDASAGEGSSTGEWRIYASPVPGGTLSINLMWSGAAVRNADYTTTVLVGGALTDTTSGSIIQYPAGLSHISIRLSPIDDTNVESTEDAELELRNGTGYIPGNPDKAAINILDNDSSPPPSGQPNLTVSSFTSSVDPATVGTTVTVSVTISNSGSGASTSCNIELYHNRAAAPSLTTPGDQTQGIPSVAAGATQVFTFQVTGPASPATWTMWVWIDRQEVIPNESVITDNTATRQQGWASAPPPPTSILISYFDVLNDRGYLVMEFALGGPAVSFATTPTPRAWFNGYQIPASDLNWKQAPAMVDGKPYAAVWDSQSTIFSKEVDVSGTVTFTLFDGQYTYSTASTSVVIYNSHESLKNRRALWVADQKPQGTPGDQPAVIYDLLTVPSKRSEFMTFCVSPWTNTFGHAVRFDTVYLTLWHLGPSGALPYHQFILSDSYLSAQLAQFNTLAHQRGIRVYAAIDQTYAGFAEGAPSEFQNVANAIGNYQRTYWPTDAAFDGVLVNVEFSPVLSNPPGASERLYSAHGQNWANGLYDAKYGSSSAALAKCGLDLRLCIQHWWHDQSRPALESSMQCTDSVLCTAYNYDSATVLNMIQLELQLAWTHRVSLQTGLETQHWLVTRDPVVTYWGKGGKERLEQNTEAIFAGARQQFSGLGSSLSPFTGFGVYHYTAYLALPNTDDTNEEVVACSTAAGGSRQSIHLVVVFSIVVALFLLKGKRALHARSTE